MPRAFYALSYLDTGCILSYCEAEDQDLTKSGAGDALLSQLVADELALSTSLRAGSLTLPVPLTKIKKDKLKLDKVTVDNHTPTGFLGAPFMFALDFSQGKPGDGTLKKLLDPPRKATPTLHAPTSTLRIDFANQVQSATNLYAFLDGVPLTPITTSAPANPIDFPCGVTLSAGAYHVVLFASAGFQPFFGVLQVQP